MSPSYRAGMSVEDQCRVCKEIRRHTIIVTDGDGLPMRVVCDHCGSQHNFRGARAPASPPTGGPSATPSPPDASETENLEQLLRRVFHEELGLTPVAPAAKWIGGRLVLEPGKPGVQDKSWPIEVFFKKIVMLRNRLRTLEQQVNAAEIPTELKLKLQGYITGCYGSLTSFNVLFAEEEDRFRSSK
ncbi:MAG TPA: hypothetical protein ENK10_01500 [Acidobacteria bacterium]|nr:hypothetical protein [Acidobacteriota bacterium]